MRRRRNRPWHPETRITIHDLAMKGRGRTSLCGRITPCSGRTEIENRYFKFSHSPVTGWRYKRETTALSWYLKLF
ncbi:MAG: hypothetical protein R2875_12660 [Desulfobacterales bacterium]